MTKHEKRAKSESPGTEKGDQAKKGDDANRVTENSRDDGGLAGAFDRERPPPGSPADNALAALLEAGPEAFEHLLKAAQELLLAAKAVVDAGERAVESHREATDAAHSGGAPDRDLRVRRIDLA